MNSELMQLCSFEDMETTYEEYEDWSDQGVSELVVPQYTKAMQEMEKRKSLEESLVNVLSCPDTIN